MESGRERDIKKELIENALKGQWDEVVKIYTENPAAYTIKINNSGDTALHLAVSDGKVKIVKELIAQRKASALPENDQGNTPLHVAASMGKVDLCKALLGDDPPGGTTDRELTKPGYKNKDGETPFFLAAFYGRKEAFLFLHRFCKRHDMAAIKFSRRNDGDTTLHSAISGEYFDLAFQIISFYGELVHLNNEQGISPLHILAAKSTAFKSGSRLGLYENILYHFITVPELEKNEGNDKPEESDHQTTEATKNNRTCVGFIQLFFKEFLPANCGTCYTVVKHGFKGIRIIFGCGTHEDKTKGGRTDAEDPENQKGSHQDSTVGKPSGVRQADAPNSKTDPKWLPANYGTCFAFFKLGLKGILIVLGLGYNTVKKMEEKKRKHSLAFQVMKELLPVGSSAYDYNKSVGRGPQENHGADPDEGALQPYLLGGEHGIVRFNEEAMEGHADETVEKEQTLKEVKTTIKITTTNGIANRFLGTIQDIFPVSVQSQDKKNIVLLVEKDKHSARAKQTETPILIAAKNGVTEIVDRILKLFPAAIHDANEDGKNVVLLAVENRQPHVYQFFLNKREGLDKDSVFRKVDNEGNSALHLAGKLGDYKPWRIPGEALQMQWELKWYEFVKDSMPFHYYTHFNKQGKTSKEVFTETHKALVKSGGEWLTKTSESCSVVAALIATVAFATSATIPGGIKPETGTPLLERKPAFDTFAIASLIALCFSVTALVMFLAILTSRFQPKDFGKDLPGKLFIGLTSLLVSIAAVLISFCAGHFFVLKHRLGYWALPVYAVACLPISFYAFAQFSLYIDVLRAILKKVPQRSYSTPTGPS